MVEGDNQANQTDRVSLDESNGSQSAESVHLALLDEAGFNPKSAKRAEIAGADKDLYFSPISSQQFDDRRNSAGNDDSRNSKTEQNESSKSGKTDSSLEGVRQAEEQKKEKEIADIKQFLIDADKAHRQHDKENGKESDWTEFYTKMLADKMGGMSEEDKKSLMEIFKDSGHAHEKFEEETGEEDKDWADWYARYIHARKNISGMVSR